MNHEKTRWDRVFGIVFASVAVSLVLRHAGASLWDGAVICGLFAFGLSMATRP